MKTSNAFDLAAVRAAQRDSQRVSDALRMIERPQFDLARAIRLASTGQNHLDGYEAERDQELRRTHSKHLPAGNGFLLDASDLAPLVGRADTVGTGFAGGYLVDSNDIAGYVELARPRSVVMTLGATPLNDLVGNVTLGRLTGSVTVSWMGETTAPTDQTQAFGQIALSPKEASVNTKVSRLLALQTSASASALLANDLMAAVGQSIDVMALSGTGINGQPAGIVSTAGVGTASGTTFNNTAAIDLQGAVGARLSPQCGYVAPIATAKLLAKRVDSLNAFAYVWGAGLYSGTVSGFPAMASDNVPAATVVFGAWNQCVVASWGPLMIEVSPVGTSAGDFQAGLISLRIIHALDIAVRDPKAFAISTSVT